MSTRESIDKKVASLPEDLQRKVYDFAMRLKQHARDESFNGAELSEAHVNFQKDPFRLEFDWDDYVTRYLNKNGRMRDRQQFEQVVNEQERMCAGYSFAGASMVTIS
jgi:hypothetical protein